MKILFCSVPYQPSVGGIETVSSLLAAEFHARGHGVTLVTQTPSDDPEAADFRIVRRPSARTLWQLVQDADVVFHNNISLRLAWPMLALRKPWVVAHHTWIPRQGVGRLKRWLLRRATNISVSQAIANDIPGASSIVPNPYRAALFRRLPQPARVRELVFVGRLVSDKGVDILLRAVHHLQQDGRRLTATLVGDGPEEAALRALAAQLGLDGLEFAGRQSGSALVSILNQHQLLVVPSTWEEPFGVVVLEGLACGCVPVVAGSGGLPDAAGPCGVVFAKGDARALADALGGLLDDPARVQRLLNQADEHLRNHRPERVAAAYLNIFDSACADVSRAVSA
jgi:glycosyltransferase involved in cell wall biosynthesis